MRHPLFRLARRSPRLRRLIGYVLSLLAFCWRRLMFRTRFIAITGSLGKTTATECLAAVLRARFPTNATRHGVNNRTALATTILRTRLRHRFTVIEVGTKLPGALRRAAWLINPQAVAVLIVAAVHTNKLPDLDAIAAEKEQLMSRLGPRGLAVLNADDPRVAAMAGRCRGRVVTFGRSASCDVRAAGVSSVWPDRLNFTVQAGGESKFIQTRLVGAHWLGSVLAAIALGRSCGVDLDSAAAAIANVLPARGRMDPMPLPSGAIVLRDDLSTTYASLAPAVRVLSEAKARRRILIYHDAHDAPLKFQARFREFGSLAAGLDLVIFYGERGRTPAKLAVQGGLKAETVRSFHDIWEVADFLKTELREGDLVLLRSWFPLHAERVYFAQLGTVGCRKAACHLFIACDICPALRPGLELVKEGLPYPRPLWQPHGWLGF